MATDNTHPKYKLKGFRLVELQELRDILTEMIDHDVDGESKVYAEAREAVEEQIAVKEEWSC